MTQLTLFGLACTFVSLGCALAFVASLVDERFRKPSAVAAGLFTVVGMGTLIGAAMTV